MKILEDYADTLEQASIDEAYLDCSNKISSSNYNIRVKEYAKEIKKTIKEKCGGLSTSIGVAPTKSIAKIASDYQKPDGTTKSNGDFSKKVEIEIKKVTNYNNNKEIIVVRDKNTCPTQSESVGLTGTISPKGIRLLADFDPCKIKDGSVTLNMPDTQNIKLTVLFMDKTGNKYAGALVNPIKIQNINQNQGLFTIQLDQQMVGLNPITGKSITLTQINGLALYNNGDKPIQFKPGNIAALTATFTK